MRDDHLDGARLYLERTLAIREKSAGSRPATIATSLDTLGLLLMDPREHSFGALLREYRLAANLTQATLGERAGISTREIQALERGDHQPHRDTLRPLGAALGLSADAETVLRAAALPSVRHSADIRRAPATTVDRIASDPSRRPMFLGRQREISMLESALDAARSGHGGLVVLVGDAGIGKTRTLEHVADLATHQGIQVLWGSCYEDDGAPPYWPWVDAFRSQVEQDQNSNARPTGDLQRGTAIVEALGDWAAPFGSLDRPSEHSPELDRFRLFDAVNRFLQAAARENPILLALDDLHWADRSSLRLLEFVARGLPRSRVLIVGTCRSTRPSQPDSLDDVFPLAVCRTLPLEGLEARDIRSIIAHALGTQPSAELVRAVHHLTEGNPFFAAEVANWVGSTQWRLTTTVPIFPSRTASNRSSVCNSTGCLTTLAH